MAEIAQLRALAAAVRHGSLAAAARSLGLSRSQVGKSILALEKSLGVVLLVRTSRQLRLTEAGRDYHERIADVLARLDEADASAAARQQVARGPLHVNAPMSFGIQRLAAVLPRFLERHPGIELTLHLDDRFVDPVAGGYDVTVRIAALPEDLDLVARRLCTVPRLLCAAPAWLAARPAPQRPEELRTLACLHYGYLASGAEWRLQSAGGETVAVPVRGPLCSNNAEVLLEAALQGAGVALLPRFLAARALAAGELVELLPQWQAPPIAAWALHARQRALPASTRLFVEHLVAALAQE